VLVNMTVSFVRAGGLCLRLGSPPDREVLCPSGVVVNYNTSSDASVF
jgi:hypothetical protein